MAKENGIYQCQVCGNIVSVIFNGGGDLVCCDQKMKLLEEKTGEEERKEKHVPVIEKTEGGVRVTVGSTPHPMEQKHYIQLIQLMHGDDIVIGKRLNPGDEPVAEFCCLPDVENLSARILCNVHGVWKSK